MVAPEGFRENWVLLVTGGSSGAGASNRTGHLLVPAAIFAVAADKELPAGVDIDTLPRDAFLAVSHLWGWCAVYLIDTGQGHVLLALGDVSNVVERLVGLELAVHQHVRVQAKHLQEEEVTVCLKQVALNLLHGAEAEPTRCLVQDVKAHLAVDAAPGRHAPEVIEKWDEQRVLAAVLVTADGADTRQAGEAAHMGQVEELLHGGMVRGLVGHPVHYAME